MKENLILVFLGLLSLVCLIVFLAKWIAKHEEYDKYTSPAIVIIFIFVSSVMLCYM